MGVRSEWTRLANPPVVLLEEEDVGVDSPEEVEDTEVAVTTTEVVAMVDPETTMAAGIREVTGTVTLGAPTETTMITSLRRA